MTAIEVLSELGSRGVRVRVDGDSLILKPRRALDDFLLASVREHKPEIIRALSARPATCVPSCYEVEPGRRIHRPWDGCRTTQGETSRVARLETCWHCQGTRFCACSTCGRGLARDASGTCVACKARGKVWLQ